MPHRSRVRSPQTGTRGEAEANLTLEDEEILIDLGHLKLPGFTDVRAQP